MQGLDLMSLFLLRIGERGQLVAAASFGWIPPWCTDGLQLGISTIAVQFALLSLPASGVVVGAGIAVTRLVPKNQKFGNPAWLGN
jgi:hypothetical protein